MKINTIRLTKCLTAISYQAFSKARQNYTGAAIRSASSSANMRKYGFLLFVVLLSFYFAWLRLHTLNIQRGAKLEDLIQFSARTPFQYRLLVPLMAAAINSMFNWFAITPNLKHIFLFLEFISTLALSLAFRHFTALLLQNKNLIMITPVALFYILPFNYLWPPDALSYYSYDIPSVLFLTLGLILLYNKEYAKFYIIFAIATLNRETSIFLVAIYVLTALGKENFRIIVFRILSLIVIWIGIKINLYLLFADNPGHGLLTRGQFFVNLRILTGQPNAIFLFLSNFGFLWIPVVIFYNYISVDFVKKALWVTIPWFIGMFMVGILDEIRVYGEISPIWLIAFFVVLDKFLNRKPETYNNLQTTMHESSNGTVKTQ